MSGLILHHYDFSNFAEKARLMLGFKGLEWRSVEQPSIPVNNSYAIAYLPDGHSAIVMAEGIMKLWDVLGNREHADIKIPIRYDRLALSPDGRKLATTTSGGLVTVWSVPAGGKLHEWRLPCSAPVISARASRPSRHAASAPASRAPGLPICRNGMARRSAAARC